MDANEIIAMIDERLRRALSGLSAEVAYGKVTDDSPFTVLFDGDSVAVPVAMKRKGYTPVVNDRVQLIGRGSQWVAYGIEVA